MQGKTLVIGGIGSIREAYIGVLKSHKRVTEVAETCLVLKRSILSFGVAKSMSLLHFTPTFPRLLCDDS